MRQQPRETSLHLEARQVIDIRDGQGLAVTCLGGDLWITQADDPEDVVLGAGESFVLDRPGLALVSSPVGPSMVMIRPARTAVPIVRRSTPAAPHRLRAAA